MTTHSSLHDSSTFLPTRWSVVLAASTAGTPTPASRDALEQLARAYGFPLYAYIRRHGNTPEAAEDLTQEFFTTLLEKQFLANANLSPAKGRFRAFLLACLKHFLANQHAKERTQKRGGTVRHLSLDTASAEARYALEPVAPPDQSPDRLFERQWALTLLAQVLSKLEADYHQRNESALFQALKPTLTASSDPYAAIAKTLGMTEPAVKTAAHRLRRRYRDLLRETIAQTIDTPAQVEEEITYLLNCL